MKRSQTRTPANASSPSSFALCVNPVAILYLHLTKKSLMQSFQTLVENCQFTAFKELSPRVKCTQEESPFCQTKHETRAGDVTYRCMRERSASLSWLAISSRKALAVPLPSPAVWVYKAKHEDKSQRHQTVTVKRNDHRGMSSSRRRLFFL